MDKDKGPVYRFLSIYGDNVTKLITANFAFMVFNIPSMLIGFFMTLYFLPRINPVFVPENFYAYMTEAGFAVSSEAGTTDALSQVYYLIILFCVMTLVGSCLVVVGPVQTGFAQLYRNLFRGDTIYWKDDFKKGVKSNIPQAIITSAISLVLSCVFLLAISFYSNVEGNFGTVMTVLFVVLLFILAAIQNIVYQLIVTVDQPLSSIYRNAFLFFLMRFLQFAVFGLLAVVILFVVPFLFLSSFNYFGYGAAILFYITTAFVFTQFMFAYNAADIINIYIVKPVKAQQEAANEITEDADSDVVSDADIDEGDEDDDTEEGEEEAQAADGDLLEDE
ncbi:MAG: hypothetical protein MJ103_01065 [Saccharofermentans sp.]|nr:hypothetical protein [Saccharofermentans sp.]